MLDGEMLTAEEVAAALRCAPSTVEELARNGTLPGLKFGAPWVFPKVALLQRLNEQALAQSEQRRQPVTPRCISATVKASKKPLPDLGSLLGKTA